MTLRVKNWTICLERQNHKQMYVCNYQMEYTTPPVGVANTCAFLQNDID